MKFDLKQPCKDCPFRAGAERTKTADYVASSEQIEPLLDGQCYEYSQACHHSKKTGDEQYCIGAVLSLHKRDLSTSVLDEAMREGQFDVNAIKAVEVI